MSWLSALRTPRMLRTVGQNGLSKFSIPTRLWGVIEARSLSNQHPPPWWPPVLPAAECQPSLAGSSILASVQQGPVPQKMVFEFICTSHILISLCPQLHIDIWKVRFHNSFPHTIVPYSISTTASGWFCSHCPPQCCQPWGG